MKKRLLWVVAGVMVIVMGMVMLVFFLSIWHQSAQKKRQDLQSARSIIRNIGDKKFDETARNVLLGTLSEMPFLTKVEIYRSDTRVIANGRPADVQENFTGPDGKKWVVEAWYRRTPIGQAVSGIIFPLVLMMFFGTLFLLCMIYVAISRLVLRPISALAEATEKMSKGHSGVVLKVYPGRDDEVSDLIKNFNRMAGQISDYREHMEEKIARAREEIARAEHGLTLAQRINATGKLAAGIAHEINNPLGGMINALRRIQSGSSGALSDERKEQYLELLKEGLERIQEIVSQILQFSVRPSATVTTVDVREPLERALAFADFRLREFGIVKKLEWQDGLPKIQGNFTELQQVFLNLILNAADAMETAEERLLTIRGYALREGGVEKLCVEIEDSGEGMTAEQTSQAFDLFYSTKEVGKGTGLGLSIVYNIMQNHNGEVELISEAGKGARVLLKFTPDKVKTEIDG